MSMAAVKTSPLQSSASPASSPEQAQPVQKRKGGRKPVYATQEERKMRNRAAQAAFRERRTEYIKHLEATIKHHEEQLSGLQQSSRNAADEVLMLRYKNSLLERILLEKGIDVAAELRAFAQYEEQQQPLRPLVVQPGAPSPSQTVSPQAPVSQQQLHRPAVGRAQAALPKRAMMNNGADAMYLKTGPDVLRPMATASRNNSPATIPTPPGQPPFQMSAQHTPTQDFQQHPGLVGQSYYPSPYQTHMEELGKLPREYDAELLDNHEGDARPHLNQQPTPDDRSDNDVHMRTTPTQPPDSAPPATTAPGQSGLYNVGIFDSGFESMFAGEQPPKHDGGLSDIMRQYNQMPFNFATSNLR